MENFNNNIIPTFPKIVENFNNNIIPTFPKIVDISKINKNTIEELYLDYFNNFLTVGCFAEYNGFSVAYASRVIVIGRKLNHSRS